MEVATQILCRILIASNLLMTLAFLVIPFYRNKEQKKDLAELQIMMARFKDFQKFQDFQKTMEQSQPTASSNLTPQ